MPVIEMSGIFSQFLNQRNYLDYSWKLDKHFNSRGYKLFAELAFREIKENDPFFFHFAESSESDMPAE
jgi:hypothetical protein